MKKNILKVGKALNKAQQQNISGGNGEIIQCQTNSDCPSDFYCIPASNYRRVCIGLIDPC